MRVLCINATDRPDCPPCDLTEGEVYTVIDTVHYSKNLLGHIKAHTVFILSGKSRQYGYGAERFIPCEGADDELVEETETLTL
jgi:hypothetical protein